MNIRLVTAKEINEGIQYKDKNDNNSERHLRVDDDMNDDTTHEDQEDYSFGYKKSTNKLIKNIHKKKSISVETDDRIDNTDIERVKDYEIGHDSVLIGWTNGRSNGAPVNGYEIQAARIRNYRPEDLDLLATYYSMTPQFTELYERKIESSIMIMEESSEMKSNRIDTAHGESKMMPDDEEYSHLPWETITSHGDLIGQQYFRAKKLLPSTTYVFRVRQKNEYGWSYFSKPSVLITTKPLPKNDVS
jgi:hypothetical protein